MSYASLGIFLNLMCVFLLSQKTQTPSSAQPPNPAVGQRPSTLFSEYISRQQLPHLLHSQSILSPLALIITCLHYSNIFLLIFLPSVLDHSNKRIAFLHTTLFKTLLFIRFRTNARSQHRGTVTLIVGPT